MIAMRAIPLALLIWSLAASSDTTQANSESIDQAALAQRLGSEDSGPPVQLAELRALRDRVGYESLDKQYRAFTGMPNVVVQYAANGTARKITGSTGVYLPSRAGLFKVNQSAPRVMEAFGPLVLASGTEELRTIRIHEPQSRLAPEGTTRLERTIKFDQYIRGRPVLMGWANIGIKEDNGEVVSFVSNFLPDRGLPSEPLISASDAIQKLLARMRDNAPNGPVEAEVSSSPPMLAYAFQQLGDKGADFGDLVWVIDVTRKDPASQDSLQAAVSATTGEVIRFTSKRDGALNRIAYSAGGGSPVQTLFPQGLTTLFTEGQAPNDLQAGDAYNNAGTTYLAYQSAVGRNSMNGAGGPIRLVVHYFMPDPSNAFHENGYLVFGEGGGGMKPPSSVLDSVAHEYGHGVVAADAQFATADDLVDAATALNEAYGDLSSTIADVHVHGAPSASTWTMLELFVANSAAGKRYWNIPNLAGVYYRDWYPQRSHQVLVEGGQYYNSTIMGHAFYLLTTGENHYRAGLPGSGVPVIDVPPIGYAKARNAFYSALSDSLIGPTSGFFQYRDATVRAATNTQDANAIRKAWDAVGVGYGCTTPPTMPALTLENFFCKGKYILSWAAVPGATNYNAQRTHAGWGWGFAQTAVDANVLSCLQQVAVTTQVRLRACNGCGCSGWTPAKTMQYYATCL